MEKVDFKKTYKNLYEAKDKPVIVEVPALKFISIEGVGSPQGEEYQKAVQALYSLSYAIKMSYKSAVKIDGYFEYIVPPLEGLWSISDTYEEIAKVATKGEKGETAEVESTEASKKGEITLKAAETKSDNTEESGDTINLNNAKWRSMIMQPEFVNEKVFEWALTEVHKKKPEVEIKNAQLITYKEGLCVQILHVGPYKEEGKSINKLHTFIQDNGMLLDMNKDRTHHEIYLSDPKKVSPEKIKTILRLPVRSK